MNNFSIPGFYTGCSLLVVFLFCYATGVYYTLRYDTQQEVVHIIHNV